MMADMCLEREKDREMMLQQTKYLKSLNISMEEVKDQNEELLDHNIDLKKEVKKVQRKLGIAAADGLCPSSLFDPLGQTMVEDRAPLPKDKSKRERFVLLKRNDSEYYMYYTIRAQDEYYVGFADELVLRRQSRRASTPIVRLGLKRTYFLILKFFLILRLIRTLKHYTLELRRT